MRKLMVLLLALPFAAWAQGPFDGTWKFDVNTAQFPQKPDVFVVQNGMYQCKTCVPPINIKADGQWQKVTGDPYADMRMVKLVDDKHMEQATQKGGKDMGSEKDTLSDDAKTITVDWVDKSSPNAKDVTGKTTLVRVGAGAGFSGSWRADKVANINNEGLLFTYKATADGMDFSTATGQSYSAKWNSGAVPIQGDPANTKASIKKLGANSFQETDTRDGKVVAVVKMTVDGNKMNIQYDDKLRGTTAKFTADKQ
jgi:hypothetical protein